MSAYLIFIKEREHDAAAMADYAAKAGPPLGGHPGKPLAYYGQCETLEGPDALGTVVIEFPDMDAARAWYNSPAYQDARQHRFQGADYRVVLTAGL